MSGFARRYLNLRLVAVGSAAVFALSVLVLATANAQSERVEREIAGSGADDMAATLSALQEATFQICGVRISSTLDVKSTQIEDDDGVRMIDWINRSIQASTAKQECEIEGYDVLDISGDGSGARATLRVHYSVYKVPGPPMERRRIAVLDFPMEEVHLYGVGGGRLQRIDGRVVRVGIDVDVQNVWNLQDEFRGSVEALLTQGRRFGVLDRSRPDVYEAEKQLLQSSDAGPGERARLGKVLGADYLLYGVIDRVVVETSPRRSRSPASGKTGSSALPRSDSRCWRPPRGRSNGHRPSRWIGCFPRGFTPRRLLRQCCRVWRPRW